MAIKRALAQFYEFLERPIFFSSRFVLVVLVVPLVLAYFYPIWRIALEAPQYPEGLHMDIWVHKLVGGNEGQHIEEINNLNHYIGMHTIDEEDLNDLDWIPFAIGFFIILTLRVAAIGNVRSLIDLAVMNVYFTLFALARFVYTLYYYGHNLNPRAPIDVEPFMPVVIGSKRIANFTSHSYPLLGSYMMAAFAVGVWALVIWHLWAGRKAAKRAASADSPPIVAEPVRG